MVSLRESINQMCKACIYDPVAGRGTWREQTHACTSFKCPLYPVRPRSKGQRCGQEAPESDAGGEIDT